ncbi:MAG TPA: SRPBCC family protein [Candidatus Thermoplasmatota archaeon]|nr:SRPBCC family protein [Candidatus Thermoplasmatota archaeon]
MSNTTQTTKSHLPPPPMPPEGKPFEVGATTAVVNTKPDKTVTLRLKRVIKASPEKVYNAFLDADALSAWLPPHGFVGKMHAFDGRVGGKFRMSFFTVTKSWSNTFGGTYLELVPGRKIVHTDRFETDDPSMQGEMKVTIVLSPAPEGTLVEIVQEGIPGGPAASGAPYGWSQSLDKLAQLVEPELPF